MYKVVLCKSTHPNKKLMVSINGGDFIHFGIKARCDFTQYNNYEKKYKYVYRHKKNEDWDITGIKNAYWWRRYILWNKKTIEESIKFVERKFKIIEITHKK